MSSILSKIIPASRTIIFCSYPDFTDNAYAVFKFISKDLRFIKYKLIWIVLTFENTKTVNIPDDIKGKCYAVLYKNSFQAVYYYYRATFIFFTHGLYSNLSIALENTVVNLWHGMPLKRIGLMDGKCDAYMKNTQILIATSALFQNIMAKSFGVNVENVLVIGQPRNDLMFEPTDFFENYKINRHKYNRVGIWLPTYRASMVSEIRVDGEYKDGMISFLDFKKLSELNNFLFIKNDLLLIKIHPMDYLQVCKFEKYSNIMIIKNSDIPFQLYPLLGSTDYLLTDYSSVWVDYDILDRPIGFVIDDLDSYKNTRGFTIPNLENELPGAIINSMDSLFAFIEDTDKFMVKTGDRFNRFKDSKATKRLLDYLMGNLY